MENRSTESTNVENIDTENREIGLRVWYINEEFLEELEYPCIIVDSEVINILTGEKWKSVKWTQFTGAYDINKKKIYEGDIVKWKISDVDLVRNDVIFGLVIWNRERCCFQVEQLTDSICIYECDNFLCTYTSGQDFSISEYDAEFYSYDGQEFEWKDLEVVGNKYQNADAMRMCTEGISRKLFEIEKCKCGHAIEEFFGECYHYNGSDRKLSKKCHECLCNDPKPGNLEE